MQRKIEPSFDMSPSELRDWGEKLLIVGIMLGVVESFLEVSNIPAFIVFFLGMWINVVASELGKNGGMRDDKREDDDH